MKIDSFFAELKRRNVYKVAVAHAGGFLVAHSSSVDFLAGFRRAALGDADIYRRHHLRVSDCVDFSWEFEITPEGR